MIVGNREMKIGDIVTVDDGHPNGGYKAEVVWVGKNYFARIKVGNQEWDIMKKRLKLYEEKI